jgi:Domain of unknown function (DUF1843)
MTDKGNPIKLSTPLYSVTIHRIIEEGNLNEMKKLLVRGETLQAEIGDLGQALVDLKGAIRKREGGR